MHYIKKSREAIKRPDSFERIIKNIL